VYVFEGRVLGMNVDVIFICITTLM